VANPIGGTDLALEFNPANMSYHDVLGTGRGVLGTYVVDGTSYVWPWIGTMKNGWTTNSKMTCTDCHTSGPGAAMGPHGSSSKYVLDPAYTGDYDTANLDLTKPDGMSSQIICAKCHSLTDRSDSLHGVDYLSSNPHGGMRCISCHIRVPHGWKRPRLLGYNSDPVPYRTIPGNGITSVKMRSRPSGWWNLNDCTVSCTGWAMRAAERSGRRRSPTNGVHARAAPSGAARSSSGARSPGVPDCDS
jgi:hypothetical protein